LFRATGISHTTGLRDPAKRSRPKEIGVRKDPFEVVRRSRPRAVGADGENGINREALDGGLPFARLKVRADFQKNTPE